MRVAHLLFAHLKANAYVLRDVLKTVFGNPEVVKPPLFVYTRWSVDPPKGRKVARQVGVGYWKRDDRPGYQTVWVDAKIFFLEEYEQETKTWKRVIPRCRPRGLRLRT